MKRIIIDAQSNRLFQGSDMEQSYDQRAGLCQVGKGNMVLTTMPVDSDYLKYWSDIGFSLPKMVVAGPFEADKSLSNHIINKPSIQKEIKDFVADEQARLEFFCIEDTERQVSEVLEIDAYCDFSSMKNWTKKSYFKKICEKIDLPTILWSNGDDNGKKISWIKSQLKLGYNVLLKADDGTGGIACGGMLKISNENDLSSQEMQKWLNSDVNFYGEILIPELAGEISIHWEINEEGKLVYVKFFTQMSQDFSYKGAYSIESDNPLIEKIEKEFREKLFPCLANEGGKGFYCCDILVDKSGNHYWTDLNARKGAILFVSSFVERMKHNVFNDQELYFWHYHVNTGKNGSRFKDVADVLQGMLQPKEEEPFVVVTNPGLINHGYIDITGISTKSVAEAENAFYLAKNKLIG